MKKKGRFFPRRAVPEVIRAAVLGLFLIPSPLPGQGEEEDLLTRIREIRIVLNMGAVAFDELDFARAVRDLSRILDPYKAGHLGFLSSEEKDLLAQALELRARAYFNLGEAEAAEGDFEELIRLRVDYELDRRKISPKVINRWAAVRSRMVGTISIQVEPIRAEVLVDDRVVGLGPRCEKDLLAGPHRLKVRHPGYRPYEESIRVAPGEGLSRSVTLVRNSRDVRLVTVPNGVQVFVDGRRAGVTSGVASPAYEDVAKKLSIRREEASAPLLVKNLEPGIHEIRFSRECYLPSVVRLEVRLDPESQQPQEFRPVVLEPSRGTLSIRAPRAGRVFLDGRPVGEAPTDLAGVCAGRHRLEIRGTGGTRWFGEVSVVRGERLEVDGTPRPTLAYLGIYTAGPEGEVFRMEEDGPIRKVLSETSSYNLILGDPAGPSPPRGKGSEAGFPAGASGEPGAGISYLQAQVTEILSRAGPDLWRVSGPLDATIRRRAREDLGADLLLLGTAPREGLEGEVVFFLYETGLETPDRVALSHLGGRRELQTFLDRLSRPWELYSPWFGAASVDTLLSPAPVVIRVSPGGPAAVAGILPGDEILRGGDRAVGSNRDLLEILGEFGSGESLDLRVRRGGALIEKPVRISRTPRLLAENRPDLLYAKLVAELRLRSLVSRNREERNLLLLNLALAYIHFGEYGKAIEEVLRKIDLPRGAGISFGTVQYYLGVCYRRIGREGRAREAFRRAAEEVDSTLISNDGPLVALRAERLLKNLP